MDFLNASFDSKEIITKPSVALNEETPKERAKNIQNQYQKIEEKQNINNKNK